MDITLQKKLRGGKDFFQLDISFQAPAGGILAIMGPSGAGKTSILKMIAGLLQPDHGRIEINEQRWFDSNQRINIRPQHRSIGYVFQEYALFPNMSVRDNLQYALAPRQSPGLIDEVLELMHIQNLQQQKPIALSGGQQQRVALARAIVRRPQILLLDEPFAALDKSMRTKLQNDLIAIHRQYQTTTLLVSHDPTEIARMADEVIVLSNGAVIQQGKPSSVLASGTNTLLEGEVLSIDQNTLTIVSKNSISTLQVTDASSQYEIGDSISISSQHYQIKKKSSELKSASDHRR
ncbi:MAG: ATP-binding cassette domain-containing protein [Cyclobacteriaceae bacterium]